MANPKPRILAAKQRIVRIIDKHIKYDIQCYNLIIDKEDRQKANLDIAALIKQRNRLASDCGIEEIILRRTGFTGAFVFDGIIESL